MSKSLAELVPFPDLNDVVKRLDEIFEHTEDAWHGYVNRLPGGSVNYLLIAEAPPPWVPADSPKYVLDPLTRPGVLMNALCKAFFGTPLYNELGVDATLTHLARHGFLLVDSIPFAMSYNGKRRKLEYGKLLELTCSTYLTETLSTGILKWSDTLRIAFAFKLNGLAVMEGVNNKLALGGRRHLLNNDMICASEAGYPTGNLLKRAFGLRGVKAV